jgi:hypothetical protein
MWPQKEQMRAGKSKGLRGLCEHLSGMADRVKQLVKQAKARVTGPIRLYVPAEGVAGAVIGSISN